MIITAYDLAQRFIGIKEIPGGQHNPHILAMLKLDNSWPTGDEVPWCSAFTNYIAWLLRLPRSKNLQAQSWLQVGKAVKLEDASVGFDVVVFSRGTTQPVGPGLLPPGHVGFYGGHSAAHVQTLGGNQSDSVSLAPYATSRLLGVRRLWEPRAGVAFAGGSFGGGGAGGAF